MELDMSVDALVGQDNQIAQVVVEAVAILVMDDFPEQQWTTQGLLDEPAMRTHPLSSLRVAHIQVHLTSSDGLLPQQGLAHADFRLSAVV